MAVIDLRPSRRRHRGFRRRPKSRAGLILGLTLVLAAAAYNTPIGARLVTEAEAWLASFGLERPTAQAQGPELAGRPTRITDGDTFRLGADRIRLSGIDAPELSTPQGPVAKAELARLIGRQDVRCEDTGERSYDRIVAVCYGPGGQDLAAEMVRNGWARDWPRYSQGRYAAMQREAERAGRGIHAG
jgi:endonuclease YncB( thermonuclease family)